MCIPEENVSHTARSWEYFILSPDPRQLPSFHPLFLWRPCVPAQGQAKCLIAASLEPRTVPDTYDGIQGWEGWVPWRCQRIFSGQLLWSLAKIQYEGLAMEKGWRG